MLKKLVLLITVITSIISCTNEAIDIHKSSTRHIPDGTIIPLENLRKKVAGKFPQEFVTYDHSDQFIEGYVISSDASGNFFKELFIQNDTINPTTGLHVLIDERALHQRYPFGSKVRIRLKNLSITEQKGIVTLGKLKDNEITTIPFTEIDNTIFRTNITASITPLKVNIGDITNDLESVYVSIDNMQIDKSFITPKVKTFSGEKEDTFDGLRTMIKCDTGAHLTLCTSTFASFEQQNLPIGKGTITGVLTKDFSGFDYVLKINQSSDLAFNQNNRCDPIFFICDNLIDTPLFTDENTIILYEENFDNTTTAKMTKAGWVNKNTGGGTVIWSNKKVSNIDNRIMSITANNTGLRPLEAWLITPDLSELQLQEGANTFFRVTLRTSRNNGDALSIWVTNKEIDKNEWQLLDLDIPRENNNYVTLTHKISCLTGSIRIGFKYKGYDPIIDSTYEIDKIQFFREKRKDEIFIK